MTVNPTKQQTFSFLSEKNWNVFTVHAPNRSFLLPGFLWRRDVTDAERRRRQTSLIRLISCSQLKRLQRSRSCEGVSDGEKCSSKSQVERRHQRTHFHLALQSSGWWSWRETLRSTLEPVMRKDLIHVFIQMVQTTSGRSFTILARRHLGLLKPEVTIYRDGGADWDLTHLRPASNGRYQLSITLYPHSNTSGALRSGWSRM